MSADIRVLPYTRQIDVGVNELLQRFSFNRNSVRMLSNDIELSRLHENYLASMNVLEYTSGHTYMQNDLVWVKRSIGDRALFLVRCVINDNDSDLQHIVDAAYDENADSQPRPEFDRYGWKDQNQDIDIEDYAIGLMLQKYFAQRFIEHEQDKTYHEFGKLAGDPAQVDKKIMLADLSNANGARKHVFYPYYTHRLEPDDTILHGFYRVWDSGVLELDIVYRLGYSAANQDETYGGKQAIECNTYAMNGSLGGGNEMAKYFYTVRDRDIFSPRAESQSSIGDTVQLNRNNTVNTYSARIVFPRFRFNGKTVQFMDGQYMIFGSDVMSQEANAETRQL